MLQHHKKEREKTMCSMLPPHRWHPPPVDACWWSPKPAHALWQLHLTPNTCNMLTSNTCQCLPMTPELANSPWYLPSPPVSGRPLPSPPDAPDIYRLRWRPAEPWWPLLTPSLGVACVCHQETSKSAFCGVTVRFRAQWDKRDFIFASLENRHRWLLLFVYVCWSAKWHSSYLWKPFINRRPINKRQIIRLQPSKKEQTTALRR